MPTRFQYSSGGYVEKQVVTDRDTVVFMLDGYHKGAATAWLFLFNQTNPPSSGDQPEKIISLQANNNFYWEPGRLGHKFPSGMYAALSSDEETYTATGSKDIHFAINGVEGSF